MSRLKIKWSLIASANWKESKEGSNLQFKALSDVLLAESVCWILFSPDQNSVA